MRNRSLTILLTAAKRYFVLAIVLPAGGMLSASFLCFYLCERLAARAACGPSNTLCRADPLGFGFGIKIL